MNQPFPNALLTSPRRITFRNPRRKGLIFFAPSLFCGLSCPAALAQNADAILQSVRAGESKAQFRATQIVQRGGAREVATLYRSGLKRRLEWSAPNVRAGDILIDDGQTVTLFHRADKVAIQTQSTRRAPVLSPDGWKVGAPTSQDGRAVRVLSRGNGRELTVDAKTGVILRQKNAGGATTLQNLRYGAVPLSKFRFAAPAGTEIVRANGRLFGDLGAARRFSTWLQAPAQLPPGYAFESAVAGKSEVWLRYSNGKKRFSIFEQQTSDADLAPQKVEGGWFWRKSGLRFIATGAPESAIEMLAN